MVEAERNTELVTLLLGRGEPKGAPKYDVKLNHSEPCGISETEVGYCGIGKQASGIPWTLGFIADHSPGPFVR